MVRRVVLVYISAAVAWILLSSAVVGVLTSGDGTAGVILEIAKGLAFVAVTAAALTVVLRRFVAKERRAAQQLRELDELKSTFLQAQSHALRTPLTTVLGLSLTLQRHADQLPPEQVQELLDRIGDGAQTLQRQLQDLLDVDRLARGVAVLHMAGTVDVARLVADIAERFPLPDRRLDLDCEPTEAQVDPPKVERIVEGLLGNAAKHTPAGAVVEVRVRGDGPSHVLIEVADDGAGIADEDKESVFEPLRHGRSTAEHSPGAGVGLTLVRYLARLHGGDAWVEDRPGGGASFRVRLPRDATPGRDEMQQAVRGLGQAPANQL